MQVYLEKAQSQAGMDGDPSNTGWGDVARLLSRKHDRIDPLQALNLLPDQAYALPVPLAALQSAGNVQIRSNCCNGQSHVLLTTAQRAGQGNGHTEAHSCTGLSESSAAFFGRGIAGSWGAAAQCGCGAQSASVREPQCARRDHKVQAAVSTSYMASRRDQQAFLYISLQLRCTYKSDNMLTCLLS